MNGEYKRGKGSDKSEKEGAGRRVGNRRAQQAHGDQVEDDGVGRVQQEVRQVIAERVEAPYKIVGAERDPGERGIVPEVKRREHPLELGPAEPAVGLIEQKVVLVVPVDEAVL